MSDKSNSNATTANVSLIMAGILTFLVFSVIIALIVIAFVPPKKLTEVGVVEWFKGKKKEFKKSKCSTDNECYKECYGRTGCCARCVDGQCETGALTAQGCLISSGTGKSHDSKKNMKHNNSNHGKSPMTLSDVHGHYQMNMPPNLSFPPGVGGPQCTNNHEAYIQKCTGDQSSPNCCSICTNGIAFQGVTAPDGSCQTAVQQAGYSSFGLQPPNTYVVSSSGPKVSISMGACSVRPVSSSVVNHVGFFDSCLPGTAPADYSVPGSYAVNYSSCG